MVTLGMLWLPIVISGVLVFIASAIFWMVLPFHKSDYAGLPDEESIRQALNKQKAGPGQYRFPWCTDMKAMETEGFKKKMTEGPVGTMILTAPGPFTMGRALTLSIIYNLAVAFMVAYVTGRVLPQGAHYLSVFRVAGTVTILAYCGALFYPSIWMYRPWSRTFKDLADGVIYGLLTAGTFGWLWPR